MRLRHSTNAVLPGLFVVFAYGIGMGQTAPAEGIRQNTPAVHAFVNARIVSSPGRVVENGVMVIRDGVIQSVGSAPVPADARIWDMKGLTIYPGLIDSYSDYGMPKPPSREGDGQQQQQRVSEQRGPVHWNSSVLSDQDAALLFSPDAKAAEKLRALGFTSVLAVPVRGIFKGTSAVVNTGDGTANEQIVRRGVAQHIMLDTDQQREGYPGSLMGVIALIRQTLYDADWYQKAHDAYRKNPSLPRPETNEPLAALKDVNGGKMPVVMETTDELNFLRADRLAQEFSLNLIVRGSGNEYKRLDPIRLTQRAVVLPVNFPDPPAVQTPEEALQVTLADLRHWDEAPENPKRLQSAGVAISLTSATLKNPDDFMAKVRTAVERGLSRDAALTALTSTPARLFGVEKQLGSLEPGKFANFIVTNGDLFADKTIVRESWINGKRYVVKSVPEVDPRGTWELTLQGEQDKSILTIKGELDALQGAIKKNVEVKLGSLSISQSRLYLSFTGDSIGHAGVVRLSALVEPRRLSGNGEWPDGQVFSWTGTRTAEYVPEPDTSKPTAPVTASFPALYPFGEFGRPTIPVQPAAVLVRGGTIWTCGPQGKLGAADLLIQKGKIVRIAKNIEAPKDALVVDAQGKHLTPGIIDAHSHMAGSGALNEAGQAISAEVRIGDVIDSDDIDVYRALAGGLTCAHVLHGSANPIGGQSQVIKLRWGSLPEEMKFEGAPPTIKFALGENVKQSNWGDRFTTRYPQTRMGVEEIIRDEFKAALDYEKARRKWETDKSGMPPRRDLELDAIVEILQGKRFIHCHSYRQDEILMLMRLAEEIGFKVQVFQHILEGYKVADVMAKHGGAGSSFSDWWAYKLEVYDAIPYNGALMYEQGVLVSFNSDSDELARRLNTEAAKAVKYGGVPEEEALKFVTINPAKQLKINDRVGSLEPGKDADFVIWSGSPLSTYSKCEQTWIDGRRYFDLVEDTVLHQTAAQQRSVLIQKVLAAKKPGTQESTSRPPKRGDDIDRHYEEPFSGEGK
jgi:imidazolonepropionase-like amidohydrolase